MASETLGHSERWPSPRSDSVIHDAPKRLKGLYSNRTEGEHEIVGAAMS